MPSFIIVGYVWHILGRGGQKAPPPHPWAAPKNPSWIGLKVVLYIKQQFANDIHDDIIDVSLLTSKMIASTIIFAYHVPIKYTSLKMLFQNLV